MKTTLTTILLLLSLTAVSQPATFEMLGLPMPFVKKNIEGKILNMELETIKNKPEMESIVEQWRGATIVYLFKNKKLYSASIQTFDVRQLYRMWISFLDRNPEKIEREDGNNIYILEGHYGGRILAWQGLGPEDAMRITVADFEAILAGQ